jgi:hypothetical protein
MPEPLNGTASPSAEVEAVDIAREIGRGPPGGKWIVAALSPAKIFVNLFAAADADSGLQ